MKHHSIEDRAGAVPLPLLIVVAVIVAVAFAFGWIPPASSAEATDSSKVKVGDGEVSIDGGEVYAGQGCVRAGDVVVGDCESGGGGEMEATSSPDAATPEGDATEETATLEATSQQETTSFEATYQEDTAPEGSVYDEDAACPTEPTGETREATVERAVDGDTLEISKKVEGTDRLRLIGVDSPEMNAAEDDAQPEPGAAEATEFTAAALEGEEVVLELGEDPKDDYGRLLAYVWIDGSGGAGAEEKEGFWSGLKRMGWAGEAKLFNETLLDEGHAETLIIEPNDAYAQCFEASEQSGAAADEQYDGQTVPEQTGAKQSVPEETTSEEPVREPYDEPEASELSVLDEASPEEDAPETAPTEEQYEESTAPRETTPELTAAQEETTGEAVVPEETTRKVAEAPASEPTSTELTAPEETVQEETEEETTSAPETATEAEPAPAPSITLEPDVSEEAEAEEKLQGGVEQYEPSEGIAEGPALETLPTQQSPEGPVPVLPDTGGTPGLPMLTASLGAVCLVFGGSRGLTLLAALRRRVRAPKRR